MTAAKIGERNASDNAFRRGTQLFHKNAGRIRTRDSVHCVKQQLRKGEREGERERGVRGEKETLSMRRGGKERKFARWIKRESFGERTLKSFR